MRPDAEPRAASRRCSYPLDLFLRPDDIAPDFGFAPPERLRGVRAPASRFAN